MKNEEIKKEFNKWLEAGRPQVWVKDLGDPTDEWDTTSYPKWMEGITYIIDDEYAKIRKAFYDGEVIEWRFAGEQMWYRLLKDNFYKFVNEYRIKPKEPVYEYQWIGQFDNGRYIFTEEWYTEDERSLVERTYNNPKDLDIFLPSKRKRK